MTFQARSGRQRVRLPGSLGIPLDTRHGSSPRIMQIVLISGEIGSGKTTLCNQLEHQFGFRVLKTKEVIKQLARERSVESRAGANRGNGGTLSVLVVRPGYV